jgi:hypothetical protein
MKNQELKCIPGSGGRRSPKWMVSEAFIDSTRDCERIVDYLPRLNPQNQDFPWDSRQLPIIHPTETDLLPSVVLHSSSSGLGQVCFRSEPVGSQQTFERTAEPSGQGPFAVDGPVEHGAAALLHGSARASLIRRVKSLSCSQTTIRTTAFVVCRFS